MRIFKSEPTNWKKLEKRVATILHESGLEAERGVTLETVRGKKKVDVFAIDKTTTPVVRLICECKHWARPVHKEVVHAFSSVIQDSGMNIGYIISKAGFQKGAIEAANKTPIKLVTYREFEAEYFERWHRRSKEILIGHIELARRYMDCVAPDFGGRARLPKKLKKRAELLWERTEILRDGDLTDPNEPIREWYRGTKPGDYPGKARTFTIEDKRDYIRWLALTGGWVMHSVMCMADYLGDPVYAGRSVAWYEVLGLGIPPSAIAGAKKSKFDWKRLG